MIELFSFYKKLNKSIVGKLSFMILLLLAGQCVAQQMNELSPFILVVQPIVVQSDEGDNPASMALPEALVDRAYSPAGIDFHYLEPIYYNNTKARDGQINLDSIVKLAYQQELIKGQNDIVNMFFVNAVDGNKGPLGRGMMGGNLTFISLGDAQEESNTAMQAFVIAHEVGHNLSLEHAVDDVNVPDTVPNLLGDGAFEERIDPKYSLNQYQVEIIQQSPLVHPRVDFLDVERARVAILDESYEPYFSQLQKREIEAFTNTALQTEEIEEARTFAREQFASAVVDFSESEKKCISFVVDKINTLLLQHDISLMATHPWRFIKIEDWLCGGFAHTRGTYIILSQRHIDYLTTVWSEKMTTEEEKLLVERLGGLLVHEQMHSLQRTYPSKFEALYSEYWGFVIMDTIDDQSIIKDQVSNPDAPIAEWLIPDPLKEDSFYWIRTLLKSTEGIPVMGKDFIEKVFVVEKKRGNYFLVEKEDNEQMFTTVEGIAFFKNSFPVTRGIDHPNEISAYLFTTYFVALLDQKTPFEGVDEKCVTNCTSYTQWIKKEMK